MGFGTGESDASWGEAIRRLIATCRSLLAALEESPQQMPLDPEQCFRLWSSLGELAFDDWTRWSIEREVIEAKAIAGDFRDSLNRHLSHRRDELLGCLEAGVEVVLLKVEQAMGRLEASLRTGEVALALDPDEFEHEIMDRRDRLGRALRLTEAMGVKVSSAVIGRVEKVDERLRASLPIALKKAREIGRPLHQNPDAFPSFFWWRRIILAD